MIKYLLLIFLSTGFVSCQSETLVDIVKENFIEMNLSDQISGEKNTTYSPTISVGIVGDKNVLEWCLFEQSSSLPDPLIPLSTDECFSSSKPNNISLSANGSRAVYLFTKDKSRKVSSDYTRAIVNYSVNNPPVLTVDKSFTQIDTAVIVDPLENDLDSEGDSMSVTAIGTPSSGGAVLNGDGTITFTPGSGFVGEVILTYTVVDSRGDSTSGEIEFIVINEFTWTGEGLDNNWSNAQNWCGSQVDGVCQGDGMEPGVNDIAYFNSACTNCNVVIDRSISIDGINIGKSFSGTIVQEIGEEIIIGDLDWVQNGGTFIGSDARILINRGEFVLNDGSFTSTTGDFQILDAKGGYLDHDYFTISKTGLFHHNNGRIWFDLSSSNHPAFLIKVTGSNNFYDVLVKKSSGSNDVMLTTAMSPSRVLVERHLNLENISILGEWEVQGDVYYGPNYGTYKGSEDAELIFTGANDQMIEVDGATNYSEGNVVINKTGGVLTLSSNWLLSNAGQDLDIQSATTINMNGFSLDIQADLTLAADSIINRNTGVLTYGTWNAQGVINP